MKTLSIGQVATRTGIRTSALRYYEEAGILPVPSRINGRRCYDADALRRIDVLRFAQQAGFTLAEIRTLFHGFGSSTPLSVRWQSLARRKLKELDVLAERVQRMRDALEVGLKCRCMRVEDCALSPADVPMPRQIRPASGGRTLLLIPKAFALFVLTAIAEIVGCYLPYLWLKKGGSLWLVVPGLASLALFAWLLTLHPTAAGRAYAAYGGVYVAVALGWLWRVEGVPITPWDIAGAAVTIAGMGIIVWGGWRG